jgi:hypothetical protein
VREWPQRSDTQAADVSYRERLEGKSGLTWEEKYLLHLGFLMSLGRWETANELIERGSAAGRLEYPALRRLLAELTRALGPFGMRSVRDFLVKALGDQPEWEPDQDKLLDETHPDGCTDAEKVAGVKALGANSIRLLRCGLSLGRGFGHQAAIEVAKAAFDEPQLRQVIALVSYQYGFPFGEELSRRLERMGSVPPPISA